MKAILVHSVGGPEVLQYQETELVEPGPLEVVVRNHAIGVNFTDIYSRSGIFPPGSLPFIPGKEAAGEVVALGSAVAGFAVGDRVAFVETPGAYAELSVVPAHFLVHLPDSIAYDTAAACLLKGLTAQYLVRRTFKVEAGHIVLMHAAAGGVGRIVAQWAKHLGATVIGTVGSEAKKAVAQRHGCDHVIDYQREDFVARVKEITAGQGCHVVYDSIGQATFPGSLDCLRPFGYFVSFGLASGKIPPFDIMLLLEKGSLFATWPGLTMYLKDRADVVAMSDELFSVILDGAVNIAPPRRLRLDEAADAHRRLEERSATDSLVLIP
ncbi:quinone oxidoreductase [Pseudomonas chlororaphis]|uniref:quinone oxidoreductase family protein n=1 Tax=Pseudomonas chlororaphis TaxID=587753 RepID=UPI001E3E86F7|nr:quinone oxidoreductase [Pseudomonas chlororaphis]MCB2255145.1 quinone oxidoreductase [Pseudomonas chlororaphis]